MRLRLDRLSRHPGLWIALALVVVFAIVGASRVRGPRVRTVVAVRKDLEQHVVASGRVWVPTRVQIAARTTGLVISVNAREGDRVRAGDPLVLLDDAEARSAVAQAKAVVAEARARVDQLRRVGAIVASEGLKQAETSLALAEADVARAEKLAASGTISDVELENARRALELARAKKRSAEVERLSSMPSGAQERVALAALLQADEQLAAARVRLAQTKLVALEDALVLTRSVEPGDVVQPSRTLLVLAAGADAAQLVFQSDERNLAWLHLGQKARASSDAYPRQSFEAEVTYIAPSIDPERGTVEVRLVVPEPPAYLRPDMTVSLDITVAAREGALTLPGEAIGGSASASPWVYVVERGRVVRREIVLGIRGEGTVEIEANLDEGAEVALPTLRALTDGQRVRAVREGW